jgi:hypothetical protein
MWRFAVAAAAVAAFLGACAPTAAAELVDGHPLTITADGLGRLQIADADRGGAKLFFEPSTAPAVPWSMF